MRANLAAVRLLRELEARDQAATAAEQAVLARWSGWGAVPGVFDEETKRFAEARTELLELLSAEEFAAASRNTLNAHYTDAELVKAIWHGLQGLGFEGGRVLEPGCGPGVFFGFAPASARLVGVELDPITAGIAARLYRGAEVRCESFADTRIRDGEFDLAVGNVPFGIFKLHDPAFNRGGQYAIHNHFIIKALDAVRPGGMVAVLTSRYTMDARNPQARRQMAAVADLVAAVRLPSGAHRRASGTDAVMDLLILRRREPGAEPKIDPASWERTQPLDGSDQARVNTWFLQHPEFVLGRMFVGSKLYAKPDVLVEATGAVEKALARALELITTRAGDRGLTMTPATLDPVAAPGSSSLVRPASPVSDAAEQQLQSRGQSRRMQEGFLAWDEDSGTFTRVIDGELERHKPPANQAEELLCLLNLRDPVVELLEAETDSRDDTAHIDWLRRCVNNVYDAYVKTWGPVGRWTWRATNRIDEATGEPRQSKVFPRQGGFRDDPYAQLVYALEHVDDTGQHASKADIFTRRVVAPRQPRLGADSPADALAICLDTYGEVRLDEITRLLGSESAAEARAQLGTLVFDDPDHDGRLVPAAEYLSGLVRDKLTVARAAAEEDPARYGPNVTSLVEACPRDLQPGEIEARLGASWIDLRYVRVFVRELLDDPRVRIVRERDRFGEMEWKVTGGDQSSVLARSTWGTDRRAAHKLIEALLNQAPIRVTDEVVERLADGKKRTRRIPNPVATAAAQEKADAIAERFADWPWEDEQRAAECATTYNELFNGLVLRSYDNIQLTLPGKADTFTPRQHQVAAVARIISEPAVLLAHEVGAGKTAEMVMGAMELRRLGLARKPAIVVPNHMLEQFSRELLQIYPHARLLAAGMDDLSRDRRRRFVARVATGDWDAVILTRSAFQRLPVKGTTHDSHLAGETTQLRGRLATRNEDKTDEDKTSARNSATVKNLERDLLSAEERLKADLDGAKDAGICFEDTGIDYLFLDEAHAYKRLRTVSRIRGVGIPEGSKRAADLDLKLDYLRQKTKSNRVVCFATATPLTNTIAEAYVMLRYLRPDLMKRALLDDFDTWAATFGKTVTAIEVAPDGSGFREHTRFAKFINVPELLKMFNSPADIKTADDLNLDTPTLAGGQAETVVVPSTDELGDFMSDLASRAKQVRERKVDPDVDNMLKIANDGRKAALDLRLVDIDQPAPSKVHVAADRISEIWKTHRDDIYPTASSEGPDDRSERRGSLQIVFCDLSTPKDSWNVYDELRRLLIERGVPGEEIRFMQHAKTDAAKAAVFQACRTGHVSVLIGSSETLGVGTNVQARAVGLHHLDCHWLPAMIAQREGRIIRPGNHNKQVQILRYVTEGSFDAYMWQTTERKARFIAQVMRGRLDIREMDDIGNQALSYAEVKALATGNPLLLEKATADAELTRLERSHRAHTRSQQALKHLLADTHERIERLEHEIADIEATIARREDTRGDAFTMRIGTQQHKQRPESGTHLKQAIAHQLDGGLYGGRTITLGRLGGFPVTIQAIHYADGKRLHLCLNGVPHKPITLRPSELSGTPVLGLIQRLENQLTGLEAARDKTQAELDHAHRELQRAEDQLAKAFPQAEALTDARRRVAEVDARLADLTDDGRPSAVHAAAPADDTDHEWKPPASSSPNEATSSSTSADTAASREHMLDDREVSEQPTDHRSGAPATGRADPPSGIWPGADASDTKPVVSAPEPEADAVHGDEHALRVVHNQHGTTVFGTRRDDLAARRALRDAGFKWSGHEKVWFLPRRWLMSTRTSRVQDLVAILARHGRIVPVLEQESAPTGCTTAAAKTRPETSTWSAPTKRSAACEFGR